MELQYWQSHYSWTQNNSHIYISAETKQEVQEITAQNTFNKLQILHPKEECMSVFKPFMCLLLFGLCNGSGQGMRPSYQECVAMKSEHCAEEVQMALKRPDTAKLFPNCISFEVVNTCGKLTNFTVMAFKEWFLSCLADDSKKVTRDDQNTTCSEGFYIDENSHLCIPECGVWMVHSATANNVITVILIAGTLCGVIVNTAVLLVTIIQHKRM